MTVPKRVYSLAMKNSSRLAFSGITAMLIAVSLSGCYNQRTNEYQYFLDEIDYRSVGEIQSETRTTIFDTPGAQPFIQVVYRDESGSKGETYKTMFDLLNANGAECPVEQGGYRPSCEGVQGLSIQLGVVGEETGYDYGAVLRITSD